MSVEAHIRKKQFFAGARGWAITVKDVRTIITAVLAERRRHLHDLLYQLNESLKITQDEIERDSFKDQQEVFDSIFNDIQTFERKLLDVVEEATHPP